MKPEYEQVAQLIRDAFAGVTLGRGVGLWQGQALDDYGESRFKTLTDAQRATIRQFLLLFKDDPDFTFEGPDIERALNEFWSDK